MFDHVKRKIEVLRVGSRKYGHTYKHKDIRTSDTHTNIRIKGRRTYIQTLIYTNIRIKRHKDVGHTYTHKDLRTSYIHTDIRT